jgi:palmitoyltransferase
MLLVQWELFLRGKDIWDKRAMPSYLGPSAGQLVLLMVLLFMNSITLFGVGILFIRSAWSLVTNVTTIESWEIERHKTLVRRARALGGYLEGPEGQRVAIAKQEFPYDVGIWTNICHGMGGWPLTWINPFAATLPYGGGWEFEVNDFEDECAVWPPPDPDRMFFKTPGCLGVPDVPEQELLHRRRPFSARYGNKFMAESDVHAEDDDAASGEEGWRDSEGNRLKDFGIDEEVEFYDGYDGLAEDDVPLGVLLRRRKLQAAQDINKRI